MTAGSNGVARRITNGVIDGEDYQKARIMVAKYRQKIANQRLDQLQKFTTKLKKH